jgi:Chaperone of endosialidase
MSWDLDGNKVDGDDFLGTRNGRPLIIKTNADGSNFNEVVRITAAGANETGRVGIGTASPGQRLTLGSGNVQLPSAQGGADGNLYLGGRTDNQETGMRLFGGNVNGAIPGGFIDVRSGGAAEGLRIRVDTVNGATERVRVAANGNVGIGSAAPTQRLTLGSGNVLLPTAQAGTDGNLYFGGRTDNQETGMRLFGGNVGGTIPGGFIDVRTTSATEGLRIRVDTGAASTEKMRITPNNILTTVPVVQQSDQRTKTDVAPLQDALAKLTRVRGVSFRRIPPAGDTSSEAYSRADLGVIAQEVEQVFPELVVECGDQSYKAVNYLGLTAALVEAVKELKVQNDDLRSRLELVEQA